MRRSSIKPKAPPRRPERQWQGPAPVLERPRVTMATNLHVQSPVVVEKDEPHYSEAWRRAVASLPFCVRCDRQMVSDESAESGAQAAHRNEGKGMGMKVDDCLTAALCPPCHREIDQGATLTRDERRRQIDIAILKTLVLLFRAGKVKAIA